MKKVFFLLALATLGFSAPSKAATLFDQKTIDYGTISSGKQIFLFLRANVGVVSESWTVKQGNAFVSPAGVSSAYITGSGNFVIEYYALYQDNQYVVFTLKGNLVTQSSGGGRIDFKVMEKEY